MGGVYRGAGYAWHRLRLKVRETIVTQLQRSEIQKHVKSIINSEARVIQSSENRFICKALSAIYGEGGRKRRGRGRGGGGKRERRGGEGEGGGGKGKGGGWRW